MSGGVVVLLEQSWPLAVRASGRLMESDGTLYPPTPPSPTFSPASFTTIFMLDVLIV